MIQYISALSLLSLPVCVSYTLMRDQSREVLTLRGGAGSGPLTLNASHKLPLPELFSHDCHSLRKVKEKTVNNHKQLELQVTIWCGLDPTTSSP